LKKKKVEVCSEFSYGLLVWIVILFCFFVFYNFPVVLDAFILFLIWSSGVFLFVRVTWFFGSVLKRALEGSL